MSQVEVVRRFMDHARTDPDAVWGIFDADVAWEVGTLAIPDFPPTFHGPDGVREFFRRWIGTFDDWDYEVEDVIPGRDAVLLRVHQWGRGKGSGASVEGRWRRRRRREAEIMRRTRLGARMAAATVGLIAAGCVASSGTSLATAALARLAPSTAT